MLSGFTAEWLNTLHAYIERLERSSLETMTPDTFALSDVLAERKQPFFRIRALADFWSASPGADVAQHITDLVIGAHNQSQSSLTLVLASTPEELSIHLSLGNEHATSTLLTGLFPGIQIDPTPPGRLAQQLEPHFQVKGMLTGIPSSKAAASDGASFSPERQPSGKSTPSVTRRGQQPSALERLVRGMRGATWGYIVQALPVDRQEVAQARLALLDLLANVSSQSRLQTQATEQKNLQVTAAETSSNMRTMSSEIVNYRAQYLIRLLEHELERLDQAIACGQWMACTCFGAHTQEDAERLASLLMGTLGGNTSRPDPLRSYLCRRGAAHTQHFRTPLSSEEIALLMQLPREEVPGFAIHDFVRFDTDFSSAAGQSLALGTILQHSHPTHSTYQITLDDLTKHALVAGVTGSGKTTTVMNLLDSAVEASKPFLVIEPAKTEYRALRSALTGRAELRVYTLGNELVAPFRLNPFEFETDDTPEHSSLLNHIDFLKAVFNAAFILYAPMPYVLETALHEVYEDKGWDLASGSNTRLPDWQERHLHPIFPSLTDLYRKVDAVTTRLGYHDEIERNVKAGLKARIGSMRLGAKGLMLDTPRGITMHDLLAHPTVLELENIGSDEEKTFLMGILLARLYEYRRLQAAEGAITPGLQHLLVFEEAHRLLKNTQTSVDVESSNMRAQAIEVFTNMLSEVRAYGQGVLVAEQIPSKLAPDVLKNTNLKIAHRITAQDDRESVGHTMNLTAEQMTHLGVLQPGMAAIYAEGADHAYLVQMHNYKQQLTPLTNTALREVSPGYASVAAYQTVRDVQQHAIPCSPFGGPAAKAYQDAGKFLETEKSRELWAALLLRAAFAPATLPDLLSNRLAREIAAVLPSLSDQQHQMMVRIIIVRGCAEILHERGAQAGWPYPLIESLRQLLTQALLTIVDSGDLSQAESSLQSFTNLYKAQRQRQRGPFPGCISCQARCLYRAEVQHLLSAKDRKWVEDDLKSTRYPSQKERFGAIAKAVTESMARLWLGTSVPEEGSVGYCVALHATAQSGYTEYEQTLVGGHLAEHLLPH